MPDRTSKSFDTLQADGPLNTELELDGRSRQHEELPCRNIQNVTTVGVFFGVK